MLLADPETNERARVVVFGDRRILDRGAREAGVTLDLGEAATASPLRSATARRR